MTGPRFASPKQIDAVLYLDTVCRFLQVASPQYRTKSWVVESDGAGRLSETLCRILAILLRELVGEIDGCLLVNDVQSPIRIQLRRRASILMCTVSGRLLDERRAQAQKGVQRAQQIVARLGSSCMLGLQPERGLIAILMNIEEAECRIPKVISSYRSGRPAQQV